ncbi:MAG: MarC family protein [Alphaproteobacteria bacterium]|nr:MarC family protein [Alphaproteobacteria bacterium]
METALYAFTAFFIILDPLGTAALFAVMTRGAEPAERRRMARRATLLAGAILYAFALLGEALLNALGIGLPAFRVAGGILLFLLASDMIFARQSGLRSISASEDAESARREDITVFPLAFPLIAGPGAMTSAVLLMGQAQGDPLAAATVLAVLALVLGILLTLLSTAPTLMRALGVTGTNVIGRVMGIVLAALAVQYVIDGVRAALG